jgi:uncharacterized protein (DUF433 family)
MQELLKRISIEPVVCFGKPCIKGTRRWVSMLLDMLASGMTVDNVIHKYPYLTYDDIWAEIYYGSLMFNDKYVDLKSF